MRTTLVIAGLFLMAPSPAVAQLSRPRVLVTSAEARGPAKRVGKAATARIADELEAVPVAGREAKALRRCKARPACLKSTARRTRVDFVLASSIRKRGKLFFAELRLFSGATGQLAGRTTLHDRLASLPASAAGAARRLVDEHAPAVRSRAQAPTAAAPQKAQQLSVGPSAVQSADREYPR